MPVLIVLLVILVALFVLAIHRSPIWLWAIFSFFISLFVWMKSTVELGIFFIWIPTVILVFFSVPIIKRLIFVKPFFNLIKRGLAPISKIERQALDAGGVGFEKSLLSGSPDWQMLRSTKPITLTKEESDFLNGPAEELCRMIDDWSIRQEHREIPKNVWDFAKKHRFLGLRVSKKYGGPAFSFQAQSIILGKIASRSLDASTIVEVPNSLGPDELIEKYGTREQKDYYLNRFPQGQEIVSFAITAPPAGSDAAAMRDVGEVEKDNHEGKEITGIRINWHKRYITFAPNATLVVLAFHLLDPENLLGKGKDPGITLALIPANHKGITIGQRHLPSGAAFPNGPIWGKDVFIPVDWVIGGQAGIGEGWKMIMECLFVGRAISLPSMSTSAVKTMLRHSTSYARIRRQFGRSIGTIEGIEEPIARLAEFAYLTESARAVTSSMVTTEDRPLVISSIMKYQTTEYARRAIHVAMDIHGGKAICDGPSNYILSSYYMAPIAITVEGANILTRSLITFAQGILRAHPYLYDEIESCNNPDIKKGFIMFEKAFLGHLSFLISNAARSLFHNLSVGKFGQAPKDAPKQIKKWYRQAWRQSCNLAIVADITTMFLGGRLKKKQKIGGRLADALSELYFLSCNLKRYEDDSAPESDLPILTLSVINNLYRFQKAISGVIENFPNPYIRLLLKVVVFPFGAKHKPAPDKLGQVVARLALEPGEVRDRLTRYIFISDDPDDPTGLLEITMKKISELEPIQVKLDRAVRDGKIQRFHGKDWIAQADELGILIDEEVVAMRELERLTEKVTSVDHFDPDKIKRIKDD